MQKKISKAKRNKIFYTITGILFVIIISRIILLDALIKLSTLAIQEKTNVTIKYEKASAILILGQIQLYNIEIKYPNTANLKAENIELDISLRNPSVIENLKIVGLKGSVYPVYKSTNHNSDKIITVEKLDLENISLNYDNNHSLDIDSLKVTNLKSNEVTPGLIFNSEGSGEFDNYNFYIKQNPNSSEIRVRSGFGLKAELDISDEGSEISGGIGYFSKSFNVNIKKSDIRSLQDLINNKSMQDTVSKLTRRSI